jgi:hypothetical protein
MSDETTGVPASGWHRFVPALRSRWWTLLLGASLMANLLVAGVVLGHRFGGWGDERIIGANAVQLVPKKFLMDLPRDRRRELMGDVRAEFRNIKEMRNGSSVSILALADALERDTGDFNLIRQALANYTTGPESLARKTQSMVEGVFKKLTPQERKALAVAIRERAERMKQKFAR